MKVHAAQKCIRFMTEIILAIGLLCALHHFGNSRNLAPWVNKAL